MRRNHVSQKKMKVKVLCRNPQDYLRQRKTDIHKLPRNLDPALHPLEGPREYVRALNATKLDRVFAKPFVGSLSGHTDGVYCLSKHPKQLSILLSGSCDGEIRIWNLARQECLTSVSAHSGFVRGLCMNTDGTAFVSVGEDKTVKQWQYPDEEEEEEEEELEPVSTILGKSVFLGVDHHWTDPIFATCGDQVDIWDESRSEPMQSFTWGVDSITNIRFNPIEYNILATTGTDRTVALYDIRSSTPLRKVTLAMKSNGIAWNPMEAFNFTIANEDSNLYTFDMRRLDRSLNVHKDHVMAVLDVDYSPTGREFVSGSFDKTLRIFKMDAGHSREVYHTKRMQRIFCVRWSSDATYLISGSDETNIRLWKATASRKLGRLRPRERVALEYADQLKEKYKHYPQIRRIARHRHVPKPIYKAAKERRVMVEAQRRKRENVIRHSKPGSVKVVPERQKSVVSVVK